MANTWKDEQGHEHAACYACQADCSSHPDAANPLAPCGDCGQVTCLDHRVSDQADRCLDCANVFYREEHRNNLRDAAGQVIDRMDYKPETIEQAAEAVYPDWGGPGFRDDLVRFLKG